MSPVRAAGTSKGGGVELALLRLLQQAILEPVARVARRQHSVVNHRQLRSGNEERRIAHALDAGPARRIHRPDPIEDRCADDNAVKVFGEALSLHQTLPATLRTSDPVRLVRRFSVVSSNKFFGREAGHGLGSVAKVDDLLWVIDRPALLVDVPAT